MDEMTIVRVNTPVPLEIKILSIGKGILLCRGEALASTSIVVFSHIPQDQPNLNGIKERSCALYLVSPEGGGELRLKDRSITVAQLAGAHVCSISDAYILSGESKTTE